MRWYKIIESTFSNINIEGPQTKFWANHNWEVHMSAKKMGASAVVGRGIKNTSLDKNLNKSAAIWNEPFRPINTGPTRRITYANTLRSVSAINSRNNMDSRQRVKDISLIITLQKSTPPLRLSAGGKGTQNKAPVMYELSVSNWVFQALRPYRSYGKGVDSPRLIIFH